MIKVEITDELRNLPVTTGRMQEGGAYCAVGVVLASLVGVGNVMDDQLMCYPEADSLIDGDLSPLRPVGSGISFDTEALKYMGDHGIEDKNHPDIKAIRDKHIDMFIERGRSLGIFE